MSDRRHSKLVKKEAKQELIRSIGDELEKATNGPDEPGKLFICYSDVERIWADESKIETLLHPDELSQDVLAFIQQKMILILSILVMSGANLFFTQFRARLFDRGSGNAFWTDDGVPFEEDQLGFLVHDLGLLRRFYLYQFRFKPEVIEITRHQRKQTVDPRVPLPFVHTITNVGVGGYGKVDRVGIAPAYIKGEEGSVWGTVSTSN